MSSRPHLSRSSLILAATAFVVLSLGTAMAAGDAAPRALETLSGPQPAGGGNVPVAASAIRLPKKLRPGARIADLSASPWLSDVGNGKSAGNHSAGHNSRIFWAAPGLENAILPPGPHAAEKATALAGSFPARVISWPAALADLARIDPLRKRGLSSAHHT